jgi:ArsR family transcriptional regulator
MGSVRTLSKVFKALSDETRLQMLALLFRQGELCVCDFVEVLEITQSKASRHLHYLVNAGLLDDRREAVWVYFRLADEPQPAQAAVLKMLPDLVSASLPVDLFERYDRWSERKVCAGQSCKNGDREDDKKAGRT